MNVYDSARMADVLAVHGYDLTDAPDGADMVILNTCHIREKAAEKVYSDIGRLRPFKEEKAATGDRMILAVAGCVAQAEGEEILNRADCVDMVFGPQTYHRLPEMIAKANRQAGVKIVDTEFPEEDKFDFLPAKTSNTGVSAFLSVQEGCDKFCTFCVVPYTRGVEQSRPVDAIIAEARRLVQSGSRELTLLGQNVNAYHGEGPDGKEWGLGRLIEHIAAKVTGLARIRYTTSHPRDMDDALYAAHRDVPQLMPFVHLPVQSGSDRILSKMNRKHTAQEYMAVVEKMRTARPDLALSSDFIVGYPGETNEDFAATLKLVTDVGYAQAFSFKYSPRPGTPAAAEEFQVAEELKTERLATLQQLLRAQQSAFNQSFAGRKIPVLFDRHGRNPGQIGGRTEFLQPVHATAPDRLIGAVLECEITSVHSNSLGAAVLIDGALADNFERPHERTTA